MSRTRGTRWELAAEKWLRKQNVRILHRNFYCRTGEIDLIVSDGRDIAFVEIKYRSALGFGSGAEHVTFTKQRRIISAARTFLQYHRHVPSQVFRFDVISISNINQKVQFRWIKNAFEAV